MAAVASIPEASCDAPGKFGEISPIATKSFPNGMARRQLFGGIALAAGVAIAVPALGTPSPVLSAIARSKAAEVRFSALPHDLQLHDPACFYHEEEQMLSAYDEIFEAVPKTWAEFVAQLAVASEDGTNAIEAAQAERLLAHARRLGASV